MLHVQRRDVTAALHEMSNYDAEIRRIYFRLYIVRVSVSVQWKHTQFLPESSSFTIPIPIIGMFCVSRSVWLVSIVSL